MEGIENDDLSLRPVEQEDFPTNPHLDDDELLRSHVISPSLWISAIDRDEGMKIDMCSGADCLHPLGSSSSSRCGFVWKILLFNWPQRQIIILNALHHCV